tara:strand:+ start:281 stop:475 length:195 start_codon:yes stop_codon:yes gene_type:complete
MNVSELIKVLNDIEDKTLPVRVLEDNPNNADYNLENYWLDKIDVANTGQSGYELSGEVVLRGGE